MRSVRLLRQAAWSSVTQQWPDLILTVETAALSRAPQRPVRMASRFAREWEQPGGSVNGNVPATAGLLLYNSLVDEKVPFVPALGAGSTQISWYTCGPTVYDSAHMGHGRNYVTFDIVRRVLEDYFGYNILYVMNVTDVDDKIILRARRNHLLQQFRSQQQDSAQVLAFATEAVSSAHAKQSAKVADVQLQVSAVDAELATAGERKELRAKREELVSAVKGEAHKLSRTTEALAALAALPSQVSVDEVLDVAADWVAESLDKEQGSSVTDSSIFRAHAAKYEREFVEDMEVLGCRPPTVMTRVSEYIPEVVAYIQVIIDNGMAYESGGSVYFDTASFRACGHTYAKLKPWAVGSTLLAAEGEANFETREKRSHADFALWKAAKPGEPTWESPWGLGRPGWHIECSAMASAVLGMRMDIHSGGEDLRFPHHDNELAQAEAHYHHQGCKQWVNYFLHSGHLEIEGLKMSKSLKNFVTIREALQSFSARQLRLMFAMQPWNKPMVYGEQARGEMKARESQIKNFFQNIEVAMRSAEAHPGMATRWQAPELELSRRLQAVQEAVHTALCDNINTAAAMDALSDLIKAVNIYLAKLQEGAQLPQPLLLGRCSAYVTRILSVFGIVPSAQDRPGLTEAGVAGAGSSLSQSRAAAAVLDALAGFRDQVRSLAKAKGDAAAFLAAAAAAQASSLPSLRAMPEANPGSLASTLLNTYAAFTSEVHDQSRAQPDGLSQMLLASCDRLRDTTLVDLGVRLEDKPDGKAVWKLDDPAAMRAELAERAAQVADAARKKLEGALERKTKELEKMHGLLALPSVEVALADKYSKFDAGTGEPSHDKDGNELDGKAKDKARKEFEKAKKVREPLVKKLAEEPTFLENLQSEILTLQAQLQQLTSSK
ncbi:tRNA synthetases class I (C) catalytic domain-containing protein [Haematococcus lacustris]